MDRVRRVSTDLLERHPELFTEDFTANKQNLNQVSIILSKQLKNQIAGYITVIVKNRKKAQETTPTVEEAVVPAAESS